MDAAGEERAAGRIVAQQRLHFHAQIRRDAPLGEDTASLLRRHAGHFVKQLTQRGARDIVAVAHGGPIRAALAFALGIDAERALGFAIANCSVTRLDHFSDPDRPGGIWRVSMVNQLPGRVRRR